MEKTKLDERRTHETEGASVGSVAQGMPPFSKWYKAKTGNELEEDIGGLSYAAKRKIFLKWKYGLESEKGCSDLEETERETMLLFSEQGISRMKGDTREYFKRKILFEFRYNKYRRMLGMAEFKLPIVEDRDE